MPTGDQQLYHGFALAQIAEDDQFTAINSCLVDGEKSRSAFKINNDIVVYLKYATDPQRNLSEYQFTFSRENLAELSGVSDAGNRVYLALVCGEDRVVCCFPHERLVQMIGERRRQSEQDEDQYIVLVTAEPHQSIACVYECAGTETQLPRESYTCGTGRFPSRPVRLLGVLLRRLTAGIGVMRRCAVAVTAHAPI